MIQKGKHIGRNEPCPCGSGKKAKRCCLPGIKALNNVPPEQRNMVLGDTALRKAFGTRLVKNPLYREVPGKTERSSSVVRVERLPLAAARRLPSTTGV